MPKTFYPLEHQNPKNDAWAFLLVTGALLLIAIPALAAYFGGIVFGLIFLGIGIFPFYYLFLLTD